MNKIDNKGFTLIELLSVIVILAIVVGIVIPVSNKVISDSKHKALGVMVDSAEKFVADQWQIKKTDPDTMTDKFKNKMSSYKAGDGWVNLKVSNANDKALIEEMGIPSEDVTMVDFMIDKDNIACVVIVKIPSDSGIFNSEYWKKVKVDNEKVLIPKDNNDRYYSKCCIEDEVYELLNKRREEE